MEKRYLYTVSGRAPPGSVAVLACWGSHFVGTFAQQEERKKVVFFFFNSVLEKKKPEMIRHRL